MTSDQAFEQATALHRSGKAREAEALYRAALKATPDDFAAAHQLGLLLLQQNRFAEAVAQLEHAVTAKPESTAALGDLAIGLMRLGRLEDALAAAAKAVALDPDQAAGRNNLGSLLHMLGRFEAAIAEFEKGLRFSPSNASLHNNLGIALNALGRTEDALAAYEKAVAIDPRFADAVNNLGDTLTALGRRDEALVRLYRALDLVPESAGTHNVLGAALLAVKAYEEALVHFRRAVALKPDLAEAQNNLGLALAGLKRYDEALTPYQRALDLRPDFAEPHNNLGNALAALKRRDDAVAHYRRAIEMKQNFFEAHNNLGNALSTLGRHTEAVPHFRTAIEVKPDFSEALVNLANTLTAQHYHDEALDCYERSLELAPDLPEAHSGYGNLLMILGRLEEAQKEIERAIALAPQRAEFFRALAAMRSFGPNSTTFNATVTGNTFLGAAADFFSIAGQQTSITNVIVSSNTFEFGETPISGGADPITVAGDQGTWDITNNTIDSSSNDNTTGTGTANGYEEQAIFVDATDGSGTVNATVEGNLIGPASTSSNNAAGIAAQTVFSETLNLLVENNTLTGYGGEGGIYLEAVQGTNTLNATVFSNKESNPDSSNNFGLAVTAADTSAAAGKGTINLVVGSATVSAEKNTFAGTELPVAFTSYSVDSFNLSENGGGSASIQSVLNNDNNGTPTWASGGLQNPTLVNNSGPTLPPAVPTLLTSGGTISGTAKEGDTLSAPDSVSSYQWQESFSGSEYVDISGATGSTYTLLESDVGATLRVVETEINSDGTMDSAISAATATVADDLTVSAHNIIGTPQAGQVLQETVSVSNSDDATVTYQWEANSGSGFTAISGATGQTFRVTSAQAGDTIEVIATATDPHGGDVSSTSGATAAVTAFTAPTLSNVSIGTLPGNDSVTLSWEATINAQSDQLIVNPSYTGGVTGSNFTTAAADATVTLDTLSLEGEIFNDAKLGALLKGRVNEIDRAAVQALPEPYLASIYHGPVPVRPTKDNELIPEQAIYHMTITPDQADRGTPRVVTGMATITGRPQSLFSRVWRSLRGIVERENGA